MNYNDGHRVSRFTQPTLPPISNKTLRHPSFLPLYMAADFAHHHTDCHNQTVHPIIPAEFFYSDPSMSCGRRIPNIVSELRVFDYFQLNTPPPLMSPCLAPPTCPDPFRSGPHLTRNLGSLTYNINTLCPPVQPSPVILQLTLEEDQAITNLLKLHHQEPIQSGPQIYPFLFLHPPGPMDSTSAEEACKPLRSDVQHPKEASLSGWSDTELEAADTLLSRFSLMGNDQIWGPNHSESAATPLPCQRPESEPASVTTDCIQNDTGWSRVGESGEPGWGDGCVFVDGVNVDDVSLPVCEEYSASSLPPRLPSPSSGSKAKSRSSVSGDLSEVKERALSDSEGDAVHVLLSLREIGALDIMQ